VGLTQALRNLDARLSARVREELKAGIGYPNPGWAPPMGYVGTSTSGVTINEDRANTVAAWFAGIRVISEDVASLPLILYRRDGVDKVRATDHPLYRVLHDAPNPVMTSMVFRETLQAHALAWGNAYAEKETNSSGRTVALWPLRPDRMTVSWEGARKVYDYVVTPGTAPIRIPSDRVFHLMGIGGDGLVGWSILRLARETLASTIALREYGNRVMQNDARPGVILSHPGVLSDPAAKRLADSWDANHGGFTNAGRTAVLEEGITVSTIGFPPEDVQFLESQKWQVTEVARWLRVAPHKLADLERATFSNIEEQQIDYIASTLRAWLVRWEQQLNMSVVQDPAYFAEHVLDALLRGKTLERFQAYALAVANKVLTPNQWAQLENWPSHPWGDEPVLSPNNSAATPPPPGGPNP
jgi:HK97 family phage portal protein